MYWEGHIGAFVYYFGGLTRIAGKGNDLLVYYHMSGEGGDGNNLVVGGH